MDPYSSEAGQRKATTWASRLGPLRPQVSSLFTFWPAAVSSASTFTFSNVRNRNLLDPCQSLASPNKGSTYTLLFLRAFS